MRYSTRHTHTCQPSQAQYAAQGAVISINSAGTSRTTLWLRLHINKHGRHQPRVPSVTHVPESSAHKQPVRARTPGSYGLSVFLSPQYTHTQGDTDTHTHSGLTVGIRGVWSPLSLQACVRRFPVFTERMWFGFLSVHTHTQVFFFFSSSSFSHRPAGPLTLTETMTAAFYQKLPVQNGSRD